MPMAFMIRMGGGGVLVMKVKERSAYTVMTTGIFESRPDPGAGVEFFGEGGDVHAVLAQGGTNRGADVAFCPPGFAV